MWIVVTWTEKGNPFSAMVSYGPFDSEESARKFGQKEFGLYWRLSRLVKNW